MNVVSCSKKLDVPVIVIHPRTLITVFCIDLMASCIKFQELHLDTMSSFKEVHEHCNNLLPKHNNPKLVSASLAPFPSRREGFVDIDEAVVLLILLLWL